MRVLLINYEFPPLGGGAANATANLAREMAALGHTIYVMTSAFNELPGEEAIDGYTVLRIPAMRAAEDRSNSREMLSFLLSSCIWVVRLRRKIQVDSCIAFFGIPGGPGAWVLKAVAGVPYIVSLRGGDVPGTQPEELKNFHRITRPVIRFLWWRAAHVVANSEGLAELARRAAPRKRILIIPNGVNADQYKPADHLPFGNWLFAGRISLEKGLDCLIDAVALLDPGERQQLTFTIVGDGPQRTACVQRVQQLGLEKQFDFVGWVRREQMLEYYQAHGGLVLPSTSEGMPNVLLEAMASGLPIISTQIRGVEELVHDNGWLVEPANPPALAQALRCSLKQPLQLQQMGLRSRAIAETYSWRTVAERYLDLMG